MLSIDPTDRNKNTDNNPVLLFFIFILVVNKLKSKNRFLKDGDDLNHDEYMVEMGKNPAFPLEDIEDNHKKTIEKKPILKANNAEDLYRMMDKMKPYMSHKNRNIISVFEKWKSLMDDLNNLSNAENNINSLSGSQQKDIVGFLHDLKPFIDESYYSEIEELSNGINTITNINKNIVHLQNTLKQINNINDNNEKIHRLVDALHPFMDENQKKSVDQLKNISLVMDLMKSAETFNKTSDSHSSQDETASNIIDLLDMLGSQAKSSPEGKTFIASNNAEDFENVLEEDAFKEDVFEEIFEEGPENMDE